MKSYEQLEKFFDGFFESMRQAEPSTYHGFMLRIEKEFKRLGYRDNNAVGGVYQIS